MKGRLILVCFLIVLSGCKLSNRQVVELKNSSSEDIYFLISGNRTPSSNEVSTIRPRTSDATTQIKLQYEDKEQARNIKQNLYRNLIERDSIEILLSSESAGIFVNSISVKSIIKDRYNGQLNIFIITENDLLKHSDQEIIDKRLYRHFKTVTAEDIKENVLTLEYF